MRRKMSYVATLEVFQHCCPICETHSRLAIGSMLLGLRSSTPSRDGGYLVSMVEYIDASDRLAMTKLLKLYEKYRGEIRKLKLIQGNTIFIEKKAHGVIEAINRLGGVLIAPAEVSYDGVKKFIFVTTTRPDVGVIEETLSSYSREYTFRLLQEPLESLDIGFFIRTYSRKLFNFKLSSAESRVLKAAFKCGYFGNRRYCREERLADLLGLSRSTISVLLSRGLRKILEILYED